jgi:CheY-like chemotaxis protein
VRILVVEDSRFLRMAIERSLAKAGETVSTASDGEQGLRAARETIPDLILLDMMLPKISGLDVLRKPKQDPATKDIPVIALSGLSERNKEKVLGEGAAAFIEKSDSLLENHSAALIAAIAQVSQRTTATKA